MKARHLFEMTEAEWRAKLRDEQSIVAVVLAGAEYQRLPHVGDGPDPTTQRPCHDCGAASGMLHAVGCHVEPCPRCDGLALTCLCFDHLDLVLFDCGCRLRPGVWPEHD